MDKYELINKVKSIQERAEKEIESLEREYAISKYGFREGDIILYEPYFNHYHHNYRLYIEKISVGYSSDGLGNVRVCYEGRHVDEDGYKYKFSSSIIISPERDKIIELTNLSYRGRRYEEE